MKTNGNAETAGIEKPRQHNFLRPWGGPVQRTFPFMEEEGGSRIERQAGQDADTALAELPQACDWGSKRDAHGKPKYWKGVKLHAEVTREGIPVAVACSSASVLCVTASRSIYG